MLQALTEREAPAGIFDEVLCDREQAGFADPRVPSDQHDRSGPVGRLTVPLGDQRQLVLAPDEPQTDERCGAAHRFCCATATAI